MKLSPVSSTSGAGLPRSAAVTNSQPSKASDERISSSLPLLEVATITRREACSGAIAVESFLDDLALDGDQPRTARERQVEQRIEPRAVERGALPRALDLDDAAAAVGHDVHVHLGVAVLPVVEVQKQLALDHAARGGRHVLEQ